MRISVDVDDKLLKKLKKQTKIGKNSPAINFIITDWMRQQELNKLLDQVMSGKTSYSMTNEELERKLYGDTD